MVDVSGGGMIPKVKLGQRTEDRDFDLGPCQYKRSVRILTHVNVRKSSGERRLRGTKLKGMFSHQDHGGVGAGEL